MNSNLVLFSVQLGSLVISLVLFLVLVFSRFYQDETSRTYEQSRWLLTSSMLLLALHYALQMCCGFRAMGDDVGAVINILFYSPVVYAISYSVVGIGCGRSYQRKYLVWSLASLLLIYSTFIGGRLYYGSLHMPGALYVMGILFFVTMLFFVIAPMRDIRRVSKMVDEESGSKPVQFNIYMRTSQLILDGTAILLTVGIFYTPMLIIVGAFLFTSLVFYVVSFVALGFNIHHVDKIIEESAEMVDVASSSCTSGEKTMTAEKSETNSSLSESERLAVSEALALWQEHRGFAAADLNSAVLALRLGVSKRLLVQFLREVEGKTFRVWLSDLRMSEARRLLVEHPEYSVEAVAEACGFSRGYLQNKFKEVTGFTPAEWREAQRKATTT